MQYQVDEAKSSLTLVANGKSEAISFADDGFISTRLTHKSAELTAPLVFVGYGLRVPEKNLDEFAGADLKERLRFILRGRRKRCRLRLLRIIKRLASDGRRCKRRARWAHHDLQSGFDGHSVGAHFSEP